MTLYTVPLEDMRYVLYDLHDGQSLFALPGLEDFNRTDIDMVLEQAARLCQEVLAPLNRSGDEQGCRFEDGKVIAPDGFREAVGQYRDGGWGSLACNPEDGGQGLPHAVQTLFDEMLSASNLSFTSYVGLTFAAYQALSMHGCTALKERYLPKMAAVEWSGAMCLTEPHCGTDLSLVRTRAVPRSDGTFAVTGSKIFITGGEHDLTDNIIHLVLARIPDAPPGIKGLSLFLVPKVLVNEDGSLGSRNAVTCGSIEHKMGLKASPTCTINFDEATGWLVGEPHKGMRAMFSMMNSARLAVAMQGIGLADVSRQNALAYARDRLQGRAFDHKVEEGLTPDPIIRHPDVKRMLLTQKAYTEGMRAFAVWIGTALDRRAHHPEPRVREAAEDFVSLMTPVAKALCTDLGYEVTNLGMQVLGGHGYIREHGLEQFVRDCRIGQLYEGTNGVQAADLVGRKLGEDDGRRARPVFEEIEAFIQQHEGIDGLKGIIEGLDHAYGLLHDATRTILSGGSEADAAAVSTSYLRLFGLVMLGFLWARMAALSIGKDAPFHKAKVATAAFYMAHPLAQCDGLARAIAAGGRTVNQFDKDLF